MLVSAVQQCDQLYCCSVTHSFVTPWTAAHQAPLSVGFSRQEYWSGLPVPTPEDLPDPGMEPASPAWQVGSLPLSHLGSQWYYSVIKKKNRVLIHATIYMDLKGIMGSEKNLRSCMLMIYIIFSKIYVVFSKLKKKTGEREQASVFQGLGIVEDWRETYVWGGTWKIIEE